jgi:hypothetical protein
VRRLSTEAHATGLPAPTVPGMTAADFAVSVVSLRRTGAVLADLTLARVPVPAVDPGWATTAALDAVVAATADRLTALDTRVHELADAFDTAARAYEWVDEQIAESLR